MRKPLMLLLSAILAFGVFVHRPGPVTAAESDDLYAAINTYRQGLGLTALPLSPQLTAVAQAHVRDLIANFATDPNYTGAGCNPHGWSSQGQWTGGCYKSDDATTYPIMWNKPKEIANYAGNGFEILFGSVGTSASAAVALQSWQSHPPHNDVIVNQGIWQSHPWQAIGVWVEEGWAAVWFGEEADPNATQPTTAQAGQQPTAQANLPAATNGAVNTTAGAVDDAGNNTEGNATVPNATTTPAGTTPAGTTNENQTAGAPAPPPCVDAEEAEFLTLINAYRAENGLEPLTLSPTLSAAAKAHSEDMAAKNYFDHTGLDGSTFAQRITAAGHTVSNATGENIFAGDELASGAIASWKSSPPHNASMLSPTFTAIGIGRAFDANSDFKWYWTTTFGDKADSACGGPEPAGGQTNTGATNPGPANQAPAGDNGAGTGAGNANGTSDRDGDGLSDQVEAGIHGTNPGVFDTDGGGVGDGQEVINRTNPLDPSDDGGPGAQPGNGGDDSDRDGDGLLDADETDFFGTDPDQFDTDGGGAGDGDELFNGTDPFDPNDDDGGNGNGAGVDSDGDGISDADETDFFGTDPQAFDTDGDGFSDSDELFNGTDPLDPNNF